MSVFTLTTYAKSSLMTRVQFITDGYIRTEKWSISAPAIDSSISKIG